MSINIILAIAQVIGMMALICAIYWNEKRIKNIEKKNDLNNDLIQINYKMILDICNEVNRMQNNDNS